MWLLGLEYVGYIFLSHRACIEHLGFSSTDDPGLDRMDHPKFVSMGNSGLNNVNYSGFVSMDSLRLDTIDHPRRGILGGRR